MISKRGYYFPATSQQDILTIQFPHDQGSHKLSFGLILLNHKKPNLLKS